VYAGADSGFHQRLNGRWVKLISADDTAAIVAAYLRTVSRNGDSLRFYKGGGDSTVLFIPEFARSKSGTPTGSGDSAGNTGEMWYDASYLYIKTGSGWRRVAISSF
jgi:hypothetical protein